MALDLMGCDGCSLDSGFQWLNDAMALASKGNAQRGSSTSSTANNVSGSNHSSSDWSRNRGLIFTIVDPCESKPSWSKRRVLGNI